MPRTPVHRARTATWFDDVAFATEAEHVRVDNENRFPRPEPKRRRRRPKAAWAEPSEQSHAADAPAAAGDTAAGGHEPPAEAE